MDWKRAQAPLNSDLRRGHSQSEPLYSLNQRKISSQGVEFLATKRHKKKTKKLDSKAALPFNRFVLFVAKNPTQQTRPLSFYCPHSGNRARL